MHTVRLLAWVQRPARGQPLFHRHKPKYKTKTHNESWQQKIAYSRFIADSNVDADSRNANERSMTNRRRRGRGGEEKTRQKQRCEGAMDSAALAYN